MKYLDFLDENGTLTIPLVERELPEEAAPNSVIENFFEFMDNLFDNLFLKSYYENIKKNK
jgi:hypothetical protein